ncbi:MAG: hypothetical protein LUO89_11265 [Methanothrix sp.]|nr:hypothetical protein [Methanothrix sp.]
MDERLAFFLFGAFLGLAGASSIFVLVWKNTKQLRQKLPSAPEPEVYTIVVKVDLQQEVDTQFYQRFDLPIPWERMVALAKAVIARGYVWNFNLSGRQAGNPLSRGEYGTMTQLFMEQGIIKAKLKDADPRVGHYVTLPGRSFFRYWAEIPALSKGELRAEYLRLEAAQEDTGEIVQRQRGEDE